MIEILIGRVNGIVDLERPACFAEIPVTLTPPLNNPAKPLELIPHTPVAFALFSASPNTPVPSVPLARPVTPVLEEVTSVACTESAVVPTVEETRLSLP